MLLAPEERQKGKEKEKQMREQGQRKTYSLFFFFASIRYRFYFSPHGSCFSDCQCSFIVFLLFISLPYGF
jgi:hypothetical protein